MSPTVFRYKSYRFLFFSREETRIHVHITGPEGEAKFWIEPEVAVAERHGLSAQQTRELQRVVERRKGEIVRAWHRHFKG